MEYKANKKENLIKSVIHNVQGLSFSNAQKLLRKGDIKVNGKRCKENIEINTGDNISVYLTMKKIPKVDIIYLEDNFMVVNKSQGIECATRDKSSENTYSLEEILEEYNAIVVHRLDRLTEGLVILARNKEYAKEFERIFRNNLIEKKYLAKTYTPLKSLGIQTAYHKKDTKNSIVEISDTEKEGFKKIITEFKDISDEKNKNLLEITLHTGKTHQIRAHLAHLKAPIINDTKYSGKKEISGNYPGYFLTCYYLKFKLEKSDKLNQLNDLEFKINPSWL